MASTNSSSIKDWGNPRGDLPPPEPSNWLVRIKLWWAEFSLQTKLLAIATLVVQVIDIRPTLSTVLRQFEVVRSLLISEYYFYIY